MGDTSIEWTDATWNPIRGCSRVSEGCRNCYAERGAIRHVSMRVRPLGGVEKGTEPGAYAGLVKSTPAGPRWTGEVRFIEEHLADPLRWTKPRRIFVNSMSDLFHEKVDDEWIDRIFAVMALAQQHTYQILTKRPERARAYLTTAGLHKRWSTWIRKTGPHSHIGGVEAGWWPQFSRHIHLGVSVENQTAADERIPLLLQTPAAVRFLSVEPLLGPVDLGRWLPTSGAETPVKQTGAAESRDARTAPARIGEERAGCGRAFALDWIIVGGESGPGARPCDLAWIRSVVQQAKAAGVPCFVKQLGAVPMMAEWEWKSAGDSGAVPLLSALNRDRVPPGFVPIAVTDRKGGDWTAWPSLFEDLRVRKFPRA